MKTMLGLLPEVDWDSVAGCAVAQLVVRVAASVKLPNRPSVRKSRAGRLKSSTSSQVKVLGLVFIFHLYFFMFYTLRIVFANTLSRLSDQADPRNNQDCLGL